MMVIIQWIAFIKKIGGIEYYDNIFGIPKGDFPNYEELYFVSSFITKYMPHLLPKVSIRIVSTKLGKEYAYELLAVKVICVDNDRKTILNEEFINEEFAKKIWEEICSYSTHENCSCYENNFLSRGTICNFQFKYVQWSPTTSKLKFLNRNLKEGVCEI